jgi:hypothetical protein
MVSCAPRKFITAYTDTRGRNAQTNVSTEKSMATHEKHLLSENEYQTKKASLRKDGSKLDTTHVLEW